MSNKYVFNPFTQKMDVVPDVSIYCPYTGANADVDLGAYDITTTGIGTFGNLDVDTLNLNGNVITDSTGTISFGDDDLVTTGLGTFGDLILTSGSELKHYTGTELDVEIDDAGNMITLNGYSNKNGFGGTDIYISELHNFLYLADKRFTVNHTNIWNRADTSEITSYSYRRWFDGGFENYNTHVKAGETGTISINFSGKGEYGSNGITYSKGYFYVYFYHTELPESISVRTRDRDGNWYDATVIKDISNSESYNNFRVTMPGHN